MNKLLSVKFDKDWPKCSKCNCQGTTHTLTTNCLSCGKIVCEKDGKGTDQCSYCGSSLFASKNTQATSIMLSAAVERRETLLSSDQSVQAKHVIDESTDKDEKEYEDEIYLEISINEHGEAVKKLVNYNKSQL